MTSLTLISLALGSHIQLNFKLYKNDGVSNAIGVFMELSKAFGPLDHFLLSKKNPQRRTFLSEKREKRDFNYPIPKSLQHIHQLNIVARTYEMLPSH